MACGSSWRSRSIQASIWCSGSIRQPVRTASLNCTTFLISTFLHSHQVRGKTIVNRGHDGHHCSISCCIALERRPRRRGGCQRGGGTRRHSSSSTVQQWSVSPAAIAGCLLLTTCQPQTRMKRAEIVQLHQPDTSHCAAAPCDAPDDACVVPVVPIAHGTSHSAARYTPCSAPDIRASVVSTALPQPTTPQPAVSIPRPHAACACV